MTDLEQALRDKIKELEETCTELASQLQDSEKRFAYIFKEEVVSV